MKPRLSKIIVCLIAFAWTNPPARADEILPIGTGELRSLSALPEKVVLRGASSLQQLVITGQYANSGIRDLTQQVNYRVVEPQIVRVDANGMIVATKNGTTEVIAELQGKAV